MAVKTTEWNDQLLKLNEKAPHMIEMLSAKNSQELDIDGVGKLVSYFLKCSTVQYVSRKAETC